MDLVISDDLGQIHRSEVIRCQILHYCNTFGVLTCMGENSFFGWWLIKASLQLSFVVVFLPF